MDGRCATCKWWGLPWEEDDWRTCLLTREKFQGMSDERMPPPRHTLALAVGEPPYGADLITAPDFGCVQHEPKE